MKKSWKPPEFHFGHVERSAEGSKRLPEDGEIRAAMESVTYYRVKDGFVSREIAGEMIVVPVGTQTQKINGLVAFSESGAFLWKLLEKRRTRDDLVVMLAAEYDVATEAVAADVDEFLARALAREMIVKCD